MQIYTENIKFINRKLDEVYGRDVVVNKPRFRLVWSNDEYERRHNPAGFDIFSEGGIFLRTEYGYKEVAKYEMFPDMWVLEQLCDATSQSGLAEKWSYEPKWVFGQGNSDPTPIWRAVDLLIKSILFVQNKPKMTESDLMSFEEKRMAAEKELFKTQLQNETPFIVSALHAGEAVTVPSNYEKKVSNNGSCI